MPKHILFFSRRCDHCNAVMSLISNNPEIASNFMYLEIEKIKRDLIPSCVTNIPALLINSNPETTIVGRGSITSYLNSNNHSIQRQNPQQYKQQQNPQKYKQQQNPQNELMAASDVQGFGSSYSFLEENNNNLNSTVFSRCDQPNQQEHNINQINMQIPQNTSINNKENPQMQLQLPSQKVTIDKAAMFDKDLQKYMANRDQGIPQPIKRE